MFRARSAKPATPPADPTPPVEPTPPETPAVAPAPAVVPDPDDEYTSWDRSQYADLVHYDRGQDMPLAVITIRRRGELPAETPGNLQGEIDELIAELITAAKAVPAVGRLTRHLDGIASKKAELTAARAASAAADRAYSSVQDNPDPAMTSRLPELASERKRAQDLVLALSDRLTSLELVQFPNVRRAAAEAVLAIVAPRAGKLASDTHRLARETRELLERRLIRTAGRIVDAIAMGDDPRLAPVWIFKTVAAAVERAVIGDAPPQRIVDPGAGGVTHLPDGECRSGLAFKAGS